MNQEHLSTDCLSIHNVALKTKCKIAEKRGEKQWKALPHSSLTLLISLRAVIASDQDVNILTPGGYQGLLDSYRPCELPLQPLVDDDFGMDGRVDLKIWKDGSRTTETATFYLYREETPLVHAPQGAHAILGRDCLLATEELDGRQPSLAPLRLGPEAKGQTEERARKRAELRKEADESEQARLQRERDQRQAEEERRRQRQRS
ncbi:hypothetical protein AbraCBS73388_007238 [Aspergillus brasiliensis]|uniref:Uncharacterized protein n=1 Tax=Aspergillus brasiliensis TaxID=319629 RepID=A0A9W5YJ19_9EURO|nr:hypothetical protein AbraCBS73388_007238 [Aspergillus brasiliensis]